MARNLLIGCDIGTSGTKTVVMDKNGALLAHASKSYSLITLHNQWAEQWPEVWLDATIQTIAEVVAQVNANDIAGICISALYGGTGVMCDADFNPIRPVIIWMDRRADQESDCVKECIGEKAIFDVSGNGIDSYFGYTKLLWVKGHEPEHWRRIKVILPVHSYIIYKLTGRITIDYSSAGNLGGIYDYQAHTWSRDMAGQLGIDPDTLPQDFYSPSDVVGGMNSEFAAKLGLPEGVPVCAGTVDCIASMLSAAIVEQGDSAAILGTSLNWGYIHSFIPSDPKLITMPYCIHPKTVSYTYGGASTAGALPRWFMTNFLSNETAEAYCQIENEAVEKNIPPGSGGLMVLPYFMGERAPIWDENASGLMMGLSLAHTSAHIFKAILEASAYSLLHIMQSMTGGGKVNKIVLVGGGSKSRLWQEIFADVTGVPVCTPVVHAEAPLGDAFLAGIGTGLVSDYSEINRWVAFHPPVEPNMDNHEIYLRYFEVYKGLYPKLKDDMRTLKRLE